MSSRHETLQNWTSASKRKLDGFHGDFFSVRDCLIPSVTTMRKDNFTPPSATTARGHHSAQRSRSSSSSSSVTTAGADDDKKSSSCSPTVTPGLQFFVRMLSGGKTLVIHADPSDPVKTVLDKISAVTGIPVEEQRLIYRGKQLQCEQSLADCGVQNDAGLQLVSRMRSTKHPRTWLCVDDMVAKIFHLCKGGSARPAAPTVKSRLDEFLADIPRNEELSKAYLQIFLSSSAPAALVMLYLSPVKICRDCADDCIKHFIQNCKAYSKTPIYGQLAHIVLEFCKLLSKGAGIGDPLYDICRSCLVSMVEYIGVLVNETDMYKGSIAVSEIFPFLQEIEAKVSRALVSSMESNMVAVPTLAYVRDFVTLSIPIRNSLGVRDWFAMPLPNKHTPGDASSSRGEHNALCYEDQIKSLRVIFDDLLGKVVLCLKKLEEHLATIDKGKGKHPVLGCQYYTILKELNCLSKLYKGAEEIFWMHMRQKKVALCYLILKFAKRSDDNKWIIKHKEVTNFEVRRHLAMMFFPEVKDDYEELQEMLIDRSQLLAESFEYIANTDLDSLRAGLFMEFKNEEATSPGVLREWFFLVCQEIFNPQNAFFVACPNDRRRFFPNPGQGGKNAASAAAGAGNQEGWVSQDVHDPHIIELAKSAVADYNKKHHIPPLDYKGVNSADSMRIPASGVYYRLTILVQDGNGKQPLCEALVLEKYSSPNTKPICFTILN